MVIPLIYLAVLFMFALLVFSILFNIQFFGMIAGFGFMTVGVSILSSGILNISDFFTVSFGIIITAIGFYVTLYIPIEEFIETF